MSQSPSTVQLASMCAPPYLVEEEEDPDVRELPHLVQGRAADARLQHDGAPVIRSFDCDSFVCVDGTGQVAVRSTHPDTHILTGHEHALAVGRQQALAGGPAAALERGADAGDRLEVHAAVRLSLDQGFELLAQPPLRLGPPGAVYVVRACRMVR